MKLLAVIFLGIGALSLAAIAWDQVADDLATPTLSDGELVWCEANRALVGLAAETLGVLPGELADQRINVVGDDPDEQFANLDNMTAFEALRLFRALAGDVPPQLFADIGYPTDSGFERLTVLAARALNESALVVGEWVDELEGGWDHSDASRACLAAVTSFP